MRIASGPHRSSFLVQDYGQKPCSRRASILQITYLSGSSQRLSRILMSWQPLDYRQLDTDTDVTVAAQRSARKASDSVLPCRLWTSSFKALESYLSHRELLGGKLNFRPKAWFLWCRSQVNTPFRQVYRGSVWPESVLNAAPSNTLPSPP